jgi:hypothetical protein
VLKTDLIDSRAGNHKLLGLLVNLLDTQAEADAEIIRLREGRGGASVCGAAGSGLGRSTKRRRIARLIPPGSSHAFQWAGLPEPAIHVVRHVGPLKPMSDTPRRLPSSFKGVASGRTAVRGGSRLYNQLADDRDRARPAPSLARLAWLERPDPDLVRED